MGIAFQTSTDYHQEIQNIGCEYLLIVAMVTHITHKSISAQDINSVWEELKSMYLVDPVLGLHKPESYSIAFELLFDCSRRPKYFGDQVGAILQGSVKYWDWYGGDHFTYVVKRMESPFGNKHSILLNNQFELTYDPYPEAIANQTAGLFLFHVGNHPPHLKYSDQEDRR